jgi:FAD/FMN-containing dehydrogenase
LFLARTGEFAMWDAKQDYLTPACRVEPESAEDVSTILKTAVEAGCHFAIKSGGHSMTAGSSNADGGITVDLMRMNKVTIETNKKSVKIEAGARWKEVYEIVENENLMVIGGRVADVGVGGLILGGKVLMCPPKVLLTHSVRRDFILL